MCKGCGKLWTALQVVWSTIYVICGAAQLIAGIFFLISIPAIHLSSNIWTGSWNVVLGIVGGILSCFGRFSPRRQEFLLYIAVSILIVNACSIVLGEWALYFTDMRKLLKDHPNHVLIDYACFVTRIAAAAVILVSFLDSQFAFCSMQIGPSETDKRKLHRSHEQVSDIEYIIPRQKSGKPPSSSVYNAYSQSWVFDSDTSASCSNATESPYLKILENNENSGEVTPKTSTSKLQKETNLTENPAVLVEEASDDSNSNSDRKLCHMRSFSRSTSPVLLSASSSHVSLNQTSMNPPIYECLETIHRPRVGNKEPDNCRQNAPLTGSTSKSPLAEKVQYASLMKELQRAIVSKKGENDAESGSDSEKTRSDSNKSSDAEFSKELEAALQLIQDLESPNTIETPSDPKGSFTEIIVSPEGAPELYSTFKAAISNGNVDNGKSAVLIRYPDSQSTSGYSSPSQPTPSWSTTSSLNGSNNDIVPNQQPLAYSIRKDANKSTTVISLYPRVNSVDNHGGKRNVTLVRIGAPEDSGAIKAPPVLSPVGKLAPSPVWTVRSLLRRKKSPPKLCPELEGAIVKSESLAYLSELELLARHRRNKEIQREIEERVIQQLGTPRTESSC